MLLHSNSPSLVPCHCYTAAAYSSTVEAVCLCTRIFNEINKQQRSFFVSTHWYMQHTIIIVLNTILCICLFGFSFSCYLLPVLSFSFSISNCLSNFIFERWNYTLSARIHLLHLHIAHDALIIFFSPASHSHTHTHFCHYNTHTHTIIIVSTQVPTVLLLKSHFSSEKQTHDTTLTLNSIYLLFLNQIEHKIKTIVWIHLEYWMGQNNQATTTTNRNFILAT